MGVRIAARTRHRRKSSMNMPATIQQQECFTASRKGDALSKISLNQAGNLVGQAER